MGRPMGAYVAQHPHIVVRPKWTSPHSQSLTVIADAVGLVFFEKDFSALRVAYAISAVIAR